MSKFTSLLFVACCIFGSSLITRSFGQESTTIISRDRCANFSEQTCVTCVNNGCVYGKVNEQFVCQSDSSIILPHHLVANTTESCEEHFPASNATTPSSNTTTTDTTTPTTTGSSTTTVVPTTPPETTTPTPTTAPTTAPANITTESPTSSTTSSTTPITSPSAPTTPTTPSIPTSSTVPSTTTLIPSTTASTTTTTAAPHPERHFDAASFFGGFVLLLGLLAIGYLGLKFYRSRTERNYHTLEI